MTDLAPQVSDIPSWPALDSHQFLLHAHVIHGLGVAGLGVDRGQSSAGLLCRVDRTHQGWTVTAENTLYGATDVGEPETATDSAAGVTDTASPAGAIRAAVRAARDSFAESALAQGTFEQQDTLNQARIDPSALALLDHFQVAAILIHHHGTAFRLQTELSRVVAHQWFDEILTVDAVLTFAATPEPQKKEPNTSGEPVPPPGRLGWPGPADTVSITQRISLRAVPANYAPKTFHPNMGAMPMVTHRFDQVAQADARQVLAPRFRLEANQQEPQILFRLDPAIPQPYRDAILTGANWWQDAFSRAGWPGAYRVQVCPDGEDLFDPRYGTITWTHRVDRGWSFGGIHADPRTGEILKGCVRLGSQRVEEVRAIAQAVLGEADARRAEVETLVCQRLAQLAAHEVGHSLGFAHNFASHLHSVPSVMDYPGPIFDIHDDVVVPGDAQLGIGAYREGLGPWDYHMVEALYGVPDQTGTAGDQGPDRHAQAASADSETLGERPESARPVGAESAVMVLDEAANYLTDTDARLAQSADADGATWIAAGDPAEMLRRIIAVRKQALVSFSARQAPAGEDSEELTRRFRLLYLVHRFHAIAVLKAVGGIRRRYATTGETVPGQTADESAGDVAWSQGGQGFAGAVRAVPEDEQLAALDTVAELLSPETLAVPAHIAPLLVAPSGGVPATPGGFEARTAGMTDQTSILRTGADLVAEPLLAPERVNRVAEQSHRVLKQLLDVTIGHALATLDTGVPQPSSASQATKTTTGTGAHQPGAQESGTGRTAQVIAWTVVSRFRATLTSSILHTHARFAILQELSAVELNSPLIRTYWESMVKDALATEDELPVVPPGAPI